VQKAKRVGDASHPKTVPSSQEYAVTAVLAASVIVLRESAHGLETLLLERPKTAIFAPGALVFPGGKVNANDAEIEAVATRKVPLDVWQRRLAVATPHAARAILAAAVRETFEETGVLLVCDENGTPIPQQRATDSMFTALRHASDADAAQRWMQVLHAQRLFLDVDQLTLMSWWVTPNGYPRRFDTRFFAARMPADATVTPAVGEIVSAVWLTPDLALQGARDGSRNIVYPTRKNLTELAGYDTTALALAACERHADQTRRLCPELVTIDGRIQVMHPDGGEPEDE